MGMNPSSAARNAESWKEACTARLAAVSFGCRIRRCEEKTSASKSGIEREVK